MRTIIIDTPPLDTIKAHNPTADYEKYAQQCFAHSCARGESPFPARTMFEALSAGRHWTNVPENMALLCAWLKHADEFVLYVDHGIYYPMWTAAYLAQQANTAVSLRVLKAVTRCGCPGAVSPQNHPYLELWCELPDKHPGPHGATYTIFEGAPSVHFWSTCDGGGF